MQTGRKRALAPEQPTSLVDDFQTYFDIDLATTEELRQKTYSIRYRVYCEEFGYEPIENFPEKMEFDEFEDQSLHLLITRNRTNTPAGCVRLVCVDDQQRMPMEKYCSQAIDRQFVEKLEAPRSSFCEVSRLAVDGIFRRRAGEEVSRYGALTGLVASEREMRTFSLIAVSAFLASLAASDLIGRRNCFAMMEPFLPRMLKRSGIKVLSAGSLTDYHGKRGPYFSETTHAVSGLGVELRALYDSIHARFFEQMQALANDVARGHVPRSDVTSSVRVSELLAHNGFKLQAETPDSSINPGPLSKRV